MIFLLSRLLFPAGDHAAKSKHRTHEAAKYTKKETSKEVEKKNRNPCEGVKTVSNDNGRDGNGRWKKGHCPNPNGRPKKKKKEPEVSQADVYEFKQTMVEATVLGEPTQVTRHELLLMKVYENALKGSVLAQRKLMDRFEKADETYAEARVHMDWVGRQLCKKHDETGEWDHELYEEYCRLYRLIYRREP